MSATATVNTRPDPIGATFLFSLLLHGVLLLGITFHFAKPQPSLPTLDVALVNVANREAPDKADFLAQANNRGGGRSDRAARPSQLFSGALPRPDPGVAARPVETATPLPRPATPTRMVTTSGRSDFSVTSDTAQTEVDPQHDAPTAAELKRQQAIAQLAAELRRKKVDYAKRPKVKYLTASTREYAYAAYMRGWSDRVER
ncbi:MAG TPA: energy transducer TonB, partial [Rhodanobacter sp.]|nr:energy transducer TonB [Rhodanobacter sp.]